MHCGWREHTLARICRACSPSVRVLFGSCSLTDLDRVELIVRRVVRFTREEAVYWPSRTTSFEPDANRWAIAGLCLMLGGQAHDPAVARMLQRLQEST